ncbi:hemerythrin domain-containing protein [Noviherbaspirillum aerium]|uniref:hemerythrin domain-containing protein n=1 Tax=Noviherbaspirillum aerium TaxID=2588497 RepID=UPI00124D1DED|nr:hemerythrin domain-containing protein [Noviherbaspirillum aerium]
MRATATSNPSTTSATARTRTASKAATKTPAKAAKPVKVPDAIGLLKDDHKAVKKLFKDFEKLKEKGSEADKQALVQRICTELTIHAQIEEEIFYPAVRKAIDDGDLINEAEVEHASAKDLIRQLETMPVSDAYYDAKVTVLGEYVNHHVEEEQTEMFKKARKAKVDMEKLGKKMATRRRALLRELAEKA